MDSETIAAAGVNSINSVISPKDDGGVVVVKENGTEEIRSSCVRVFISVGSSGDEADSVNVNVFEASSLGSENPEEVSVETKDEEELSQKNVEILQENKSGENVKENNQFVAVKPSYDDLIVAADGMNITSEGDDVVIEDIPVGLQGPGVVVVVNGSEETTTNLPEIEQNDAQLDGKLTENNSSHMVKVAGQVVDNVEETEEFENIGDDDQLKKLLVNGGSTELEEDKSLTAEPAHDAIIVDGVRLTTEGDSVVEVIHLNDSEPGRAKDASFTEHSDQEKNGDDVIKRFLQKAHDMEVSASDEETDGIIIGSSEASKQFLEELEQRSAGGSQSEVESSSDRSQMIGGKIATDSDEEVDTYSDRSKITKLSEEERKKLEGIQQLRVKFLRLVHRLGQSSEDPIASHVLYHLEELDVAGRPSTSPAFSLDAAKRTARELESQGKDDLNLYILVIGKSGVGKSATINSIFGENKACIDAFEPATTSVKVITGMVDGVHIRVFDTPGLKTSGMDQSTNRKILASVKKATKKCPPYIVLYVDRLDSQTRDFDDLLMLRTITSSLGPQIWQSAIVTLSHAASAPPDGPSGVPLSYDVFVAQRSLALQQSIGQAVTNLHLTIPVSLVENHPSSCCKNRDGLKVLPNGQAWRPQMLMLCYSMKILSEATALRKLHDQIERQQLFGFRVRVPPLSYLLSWLLQSRTHPNLSATARAADTVLMPDMVLPPSFDGDNPAYRYRFLGPSPPFLAGPMLESHGWDHDSGYNNNGFYLEQKNLPLATRFPASVTAELIKDKKKFNVRLESSVAAEHGETSSTMAGFDVLHINNKLAYTVRGETKFKYFKKNKTTAGFSVTFVDENVAAGVKIEDQIPIGKHLVLVGSTGTVRSRSGDAAYGANLQVKHRREAEFPMGQDQEDQSSLLGLSLVKRRDYLALEANLQLLFSLGRGSKTAVRMGLNNRSSGQIIVRTSITDKLQNAIVLPVLLVIYTYRAIMSRIYED